MRFVRIPHHSLIHVSALQSRSTSLADFSEDLDYKCEAVHDFKEPVEMSETRTWFWFCPLLVSPVQSNASKEKE